MNTQINETLATLPTSELESITKELAPVVESRWKRTDYLLIPIIGFYVADKIASQNQEYIASRIINSDIFAAAFFLGLAAISVGILAYNNSGQRKIDATTYKSARALLEERATQP